MSSIKMKGRQLIQIWRDREEPLGHVEEEQGMGVLWPKDTYGVTNTPGTVIRAEVYPTFIEALEKAIKSPSSFMLHQVWLREKTTEDIVTYVEEHWSEVAEEMGEPESQENFLERLRGALKHAPTETLSTIAKEVAKGITVAALLRLIFGG